MSTNKRAMESAGYIVSVLLLLSLWSCGTSDEAYHSPMRVDIDARHEVSIFDIFERIELIPLETTDESIFQNVHQLYYHNGVLYIRDWRKIFAFDATTGQFLFKIDDQGQGPNEYIHIADFEIIGHQNKMLILDPIGRNLLEYDLNGTFVNRIGLPEIINAYLSIRYLGNDIFAFWTFDRSNRLKFYDRSLNSIFLETSPGIEEITFSATIPPRMFGDFFMKEGAFDNSVYEVFPDGTYSMVYTWDFGRLNNCVSMVQNFPERLSNAEEARRWQEQVSNSEVVNYLFIAIGGNQAYRYANVLRRNQFIHLLHNISKGHTHVFTEFSESAPFIPLFWSDEFVIGLGPFGGYGKETIPDEILDDRNLEIKRNICEFDNPVLIKYFFGSR